MNLIVAVDESWNIGNRGELLCYIPEDLKYFKQTTLDKTIIMGRKTLESLPLSKVLPRRRNIILTRNRDYQVDGGEVCHSMDQLLKLISDTQSDNLFVMGGAQIYLTLLAHCNKAYVTKIHHQFDADTSLNNLDLDLEWQLIKQSDQYKSVKGWFYSFLEYKRV